VNGPRGKSAVAVAQEDRVGAAVGAGDVKMPVVVEVRDRKAFGRPFFVFDEGRRFEGSFPVIEGDRQARIERAADRGVGPSSLKSPVATLVKGPEPGIG